MQNNEYMRMPQKYNTKLRIYVYANATNCKFINSKHSDVFVISNREKAFTLIELILAIAILAILDAASFDSNGAIETVYNGSNDDPHTQKVTVFVITPDNEQFSFLEYFSRYLNESTAQTSWLSQSCATMSATSLVSAYCSINPAGSIDVSGGGNFKLQTQ